MPEHERPGTRHTRTGPTSRIEPPWSEMLAEGAHARQTTSFASETPASFAVTPTRIVSGGPGRRLRHQQAASIVVHPTGALLVSCRWDERGDAEGDATNEQALYFSDDGGQRWRMANGGQPIATLGHGSSFTEPSSITHSFVCCDSGGRTWLYYTINQPHTWGEGRPHRSTGGGEIRRLELVPSDGDWRPAARSEIVWDFMRPVTDGRGGTVDDVRLLSLNGVTRLRSGRWLMPVAGRATVPDPRGAFWKLNRCWVLASDDDGRSWHDLAFIGGSDALCLCEPTVFETSRDGRLVALMRVQYDTGQELYRSDSDDGGASWSAPVASGLPNTGGSGVKPYAVRLSTGQYALLQTNEHLVTDRTNVSLFLSDDRWLNLDTWPLVKVISSECRRHWLGSAYGWLAEARDGTLHAVWVSFSGEENHLNHTRLTPAWSGGTVVEPLAPADELGDDLPRLADSGAGRRALLFPNTRSRAHLPRFALAATPPFELELSYLIEEPPIAADFHLLELRSRNGRELAWRLALRPALGASLWSDANQGWFDTRLELPPGGRLDTLIRVLDNKHLRISLNGAELPDAQFLKTADPVTTAYLGANVTQAEPCRVAVLGASLRTLSGSNS